MSVNLGENKIADIVKATAGTGGTGDYNDLINKPQINGVTLAGNLTTEDLNIDVSNIDAYTKQETDNLIDSKIAEAGTVKADKTYVDTQLNLKADKSSVETSLALKANVSDVYTKDDTNSAISTAIQGKADTTYVDNQLSTKADKSTTYTKTEVDNSISSLSASMNTRLNNKADKSDTYTKTETTEAINSAITGKADVTYVDGKLDLKADKETTYTKEEVDKLVDNPTITGDTLPIGTMILWSGTTTPQNWLLCDGREISRETYSELFAAIGTIWGAGDGSTSFNLPNYTDRFPLGAGGDVDLAETGGEKNVTLTLSQMPRHSHQQSIPTNNTGSKTVNSYGHYFNDNTVSYAFEHRDLHLLNILPYTGEMGDSEAHNNMPPYAGSYYIIKAKQSAGVVATVVDTLESTSKTDALSANMGKKLNDASIGMVLYDNETGTNDNFTLNDKIENYKYVEVFYRQEQYSNSYKSVKVYNPSGKKIRMDDMWYNDNKAYIFGTNVTFAGTNATISDRMGWVITDDLKDYGSAINTLKVVRVVGYK